jgi:DNA-binding transcriptional LysR family regulator
VFEGEFDDGVRIGRLRDSSLIARKIAPIRLAVCAAPHYLARHGVPKTPDGRHHPATDLHHRRRSAGRQVKLVRLLPDYRPPEQGLHALYPPGRPLSAKVRGFADLLVARFGGEPVWDRA